jgi:hypothetical protein
MSVTLRIVLIIGAVICFLSMIRQIRKSKMLIDYSIFWVLFSLLLIILAVFPKLAYWASDLLGFGSPSNFVFVLIIFILIIRDFTVTEHLSRLQAKTDNLAQNIALKESENSKKIE